MRFGTDSLAGDDIRSYDASTFSLSARPPSSAGCSLAHVSTHCTLKTRSAASRAVVLCLWIAPRHTSGARPATSRDRLRFWAKPKRCLLWDLMHPCAAVDPRQVHQVRQGQLEEGRGPITGKSAQGVSREYRGSIQGVLREYVRREFALLSGATTPITADIHIYVHGVVVCALNGCAALACIDSHDTALATVLRTVEAKQHRIAAERIQTYIHEHIKALI
jgi:hypothetical protein